MLRGCPACDDGLRGAVGFYALSAAVLSMGPMVRDFHERVASAVVRPSIGPSVSARQRSGLSSTALDEAVPVPRRRTTRARQASQCADAHGWGRTGRRALQHEADGHCGHCRRRGENDVTYR